MLIVIEKLFTPAEIGALRSRLLAAPWADGAATAGDRAVQVKQNLQVPMEDPVARDVGQIILQRLGQNQQFLAAALPVTIHPPRFNLYRDSGHYGAHVDGALMRLPGEDRLLRTDLSATLFLNDPGDYDGGELTIEGQFGGQSVKLPAGDMVLYPSSSLHKVTPVTRGMRIASFFWMQSAVRDNDARAMLYDLDRSIQSLAAGHGRDDADIDRLMQVYHNLLRRWADL